MTGLHTPKLLLSIACLAPVAAGAGGIQTLDVVEVSARADDLVGVATAASEGSVTARQLGNRPLLRPAEVLETVPGLIVSQHSGDGKANQYYLRGFNLDHGTDFATSLMGMPVNMPTHGQGYADLQFLIPELVDTLRYRKGPYAADVGDFGSAGSAAIDYARVLKEDFIDLSVGSHGYRRALLAGSPALASGNLLYALEWAGNDGPWAMPENLDKLNGLLRYSQGSRSNGWSVAAMAYTAKWASTDQVPQRAIDSGLISRYGNLDPSDGGRTHRYSLSGEWSRQDADGWLRGNVYAMDYSLNLWSNFTFCTLGCNPGPGDQFEQADRRQVYGFNLAQTWYGNGLAKGADFTLGLQSRLDDIGRVGLYTTTARQRWGTVAESRVKEGSLALYAESQIQWLDTFRSIVGWRQDFYNFDVTSNTLANSGNVGARIGSPKLSLVFGPWHKTEYYANLGYGFHSNDARGVTARTNPDFRDPGYGTPVDSSTPLVRTKGYELGMRSAILPGLQTSLALWQLDIASELVFAGDAGTTEPSFPSKRTGIEWASYWTPTAAIIVDADLALSRARYTRVDDSVPGPYVPGAVQKVASLGASYDNGGPWSGGVRLRYFGPRPLIEDDSVRSKGSTLINLRASYRLDRRTRLSLDVLNALNRKVSDIDYYYASQLSGEAAPVSDIHTHPAEPRSYRLSLRIGF
ncbi:TonB-dependent receptor [Zoogloea sp. LCSB751]|uniref:TonB-dependent receptor n=1 Tax=Zoogloea sp. LCSB751 TaxID=1965277 RepID=UPI0009A49B60|nr:TonB-dependent receptor [Zoogloea sp. LCSB751]